MRILEAAGMRRERLSRQALRHHELGWADEVGHAILGEEWVASGLRLSGRAPPTQVANW